MYAKRTSKKRVNPKILSNMLARALEKRAAKFIERYKSKVARRLLLAANSGQRSVVYVLDKHRGKPFANQIANALKNEGLKVKLTSRREYREHKFKLTVSF